MTTIILIAALVILLCVTSAKLSNKVNIPYLILFMLVGVLFGSSGLFKIEFNDYKLKENICSIALVFIMFINNTIKPDIQKTVSFFFSPFVFIQFCAKILLRYWIY